MCRCAAIGCKRKVRATPFDVVPKAGLAQHLCYRHGWWYACSNQSEYVHTCLVAFPPWSAADIAVWLAWCGI